MASFNERLFVKKIVSCLIIKKVWEVIVSIGVVKLNVNSNRNSPKKKKKSQKIKRKYDVDLDVMVVKWNWYINNLTLLFKVSLVKLVNISNTWVLKSELQPDLYAAIDPFFILNITIKFRINI